MVLSPMKESYVELYQQVRGDWSVLEVMLEPSYEGWLGIKWSKRGRQTLIELSSHSHLLSLSTCHSRNLNPVKWRRGRTGNRSFRSHSSKRM